MAIQKFDVVFESQRQISPNVLHLVFTRQDGGPFDFVPGQFLTFLLPHPECVKRRSYSLATMPGESGKIEVSMSYVEGGYASEIFFSLKAGDTFHVMGPAGKLVMADDSATRYVLVGTGTGIAPYRTMLPGLASRMKANPTFAATILQGAQYRDDLIYREDFLAAAASAPHLTYQSHLSREDLTTRESHEFSGYVQHAFKGLHLSPEHDIVFLCGNPSMIDDAYAWLTEHGFDGKSVRREKYISSN